ncbi:hypothetical protein [Actinoplanes sp. NPDC049599]|uniref:hypothetical protein n=1 Tax=Actinoplanes sp. NPDC049599 TaxID=3363903 RepID=UPI00379A03D2
MPPPRIVLLVLGVAAAVPVLCDLTGLTGWVPEIATVIALLAAAAYAVLAVRRPVARWAPAAGAVLLAAVPVSGLVLVDAWPALLSGTGQVHRIFRQEADADHLGLLFLVAAAVALTVGVAALPRRRRPAWQTASAVVVALAPLAYVGHDVAGSSPFSDTVPAELWWHLTPGLAATVLTGVALVLAVTRADRWLLLPAGALLLQVTAARWTEGAADSWTPARLSARLDDSVSTFLTPGLRTEVTTAPALAVDIKLGAGLATAAFLLGPALLALGAARTENRPMPADGPARPEDA